MATSIIPQTQGMISAERVRIAQNTDVPAGSNLDLTNVSVAKTGYRMIGAAGVFFETGSLSSSAGAQYCRCWSFDFNVENQTVTARCRGTGSNGGTAVNIYAIVIYEKL